MKNLLVKIMILASLLGMAGCKNSADQANWSKRKINNWFEKGEWLNGWQVKPDASINRRELVVSYFKYKDRWDKAFSFLKNNDLAMIDAKRYEIDGSDVFATISEYMTKNDEDARYEAHLKYADIQYVITGKELIGLAPMSKKGEVLEHYNEANDIIFVTVSRFRNLEATPENFFIFFPDDIHRPGLKDGENKTVRKIVVKVRIN